MDWEGTEGGGYFSSSLVSGVGGGAANEGEVKFTQGCLQGGEDRSCVQACAWFYSKFLFFLAISSVCEREIVAQRGVSLEKGRKVFYSEG